MRTSMLILRIAKTRIMHHSSVISHHRHSPFARLRNMPYLSGDIEQLGSMHCDVFQNELGNRRRRACCARLSRSPRPHGIVAEKMADFFAIRRVRASANDSPFLDVSWRRVIGRFRPSSSRCIKSCRVAALAGIIERYIVRHVAGMHALLAKYLELIHMYDGLRR